MATKIRLIFADTLGVKPFRNFSVYTNDGVRATAAKDVFRFTRIGRTTEPNEERVVEYVLETTWPGAAVGDHLATGDTLAHHMVQYVRFVAEEFQPDGALAEIEVETVGDNVVLGIIERGGGVRGGLTYGKTNDVGFRVEKDPVSVNDLHATLLHQFGIDHLRLTYRFQGRDFRLTDVAGRILDDWIA